MSLIDFLTEVPVKLALESSWFIIFNSSSSVLFPKDPRSFSLNPSHCIIPSETNNCSPFSLFSQTISSVTDFSQPSFPPNQERISSSDTLHFSRIPFETSEVLPIISASIVSVPDFPGKEAVTWLSFICNTVVSESYFSFTSVESKELSELVVSCVLSSKESEVGSTPVSSASSFPSFLYFSMISRTSLFNGRVNVRVWGVYPL